MWNPHHPHQESLDLQSNKAKDTLQRKTRLFVNRLTYISADYFTNLTGLVSKIVKNLIELLDLSDKTWK